MEKLGSKFVLVQYNCTVYPFGSVSIHGWLGCFLIIPFYVYCNGSAFQICPYPRDAELADCGDRDIILHVALRYNFTCIFQFHNLFKNFFCLQHVVVVVLVLFLWFGWFPSFFFELFLSLFYSSFP